MMRRVDDWTTAKGRYAEARFAGRLLCVGLVGAVTDDGDTIFIQPFVGVRRTFHKSESCEIWVLTGM